MTSPQKYPQNLPSYSLWVATFFGAGLLRPMPGTWGTLFALPLGLLICFHYGSIGILIASCFLYFIGVWVSYIWLQHSKEDLDPSSIVIDEAIGIWIALSALDSFDIYQIILAFLLFRILDIWKPFPIGWIDKNIKGANGIMLDDVLAGLIAALLLFIFNLYI